MSDPVDSGDWKQVDFFDIKAGDVLAIVTRATSDAPDTLTEGYVPVIRVEVDTEDVIYRWEYEEDSNDD